MKAFTFLRTVSLVLLVALCAPQFALGAKKNEPSYSQEFLEGAGQGNSGSANVRVTVVCKKPDKVTDGDLGNAAIHAILFKGYDDSSNTLGGRSTRHAPLAGSMTKETEHADFFKNFFESGNALAYVKFIDHTRRVAKYGKESKVSVECNIDVVQLRKDLEKQGVIDGLGNIF